MPDPTHAVLVRTSALRAGDLDRLNEILDAAGLGRPLGEPARTDHEYAQLPLAAGAEPARIRDAVLAARGTGAPVPELELDATYTLGVAHAVPDSFLLAFGDKLGHGIGWLPVPLDRLPDAQPWYPDGHQPVIAVLDTRVQPHVWLPKPVGERPFCVGPDGTGRKPRVPVHTDPSSVSDLASHRGHATFIAGLIRQVAPHAQVLSVPVMGDDGRASERNVVAALTWLADGYLASGARLDVVLMAFGRPFPEHPEEMGQIEELRLAIANLAGRGVTLVASAGNDGTDRRTVPACFAEAPDATVVSVGAGHSADEPAWFSNRGSWVKQWRPGSDVLSIMPMRPASDSEWQCATSCFGEGFSAALPYDAWGGAARGSGTSYAAAVYAAEVAERLATGEP